MTTIEIIGAGPIGSQIARAVENDYDVVISNSRGPETLSALIAELGPKARAATAVEAAKAGDIVVVSVPLKNYRKVPVEPWRAKSISTPTITTLNVTATFPSSTTKSNHYVRTPAGPSANLEGRQSLQPYLCR